MYTIGIIIGYIMIMSVFISEENIEINNIEDVRTYQHALFSNIDYGPIILLGSIFWPISIFVSIMFLIFSRLTSYVLLWIFKNED